MNIFHYDAAEYKKYLPSIIIILVFVLLSDNFGYHQEYYSFKYVMF